MKRDLGKLAAAALSAAMIATGPAAAQKQGGILRAGHFDSPASMSMLEESTLAVNRPLMGVFNNLVMFDRGKPLSSILTDSPLERAGFEPSVPNDTPCALSRALQNCRQAIPQFNAAGMYSYPPRLASVGRAPTGALGFSVAPPGDVGDALRTDMLGVNFAGRNGTAVSDTERFRVPATGQRDLAADHHDARIPIVCVIGVHHPRLETAIEDLVTLASQIGLKFALVHDKSSYH